MNEAYLKKIEDPFATFKTMEGFKPEKWAIMLTNKAPHEDEPFGYYRTKAEALADAVEFGLTMVKKGTK